MTNWEKYFGTPKKAAGTISKISNRLCYYWFRCEIDYDLERINDPCPLAEMGLCGTMQFNSFNLANEKWLQEEE